MIENYLLQHDDPSSGWGQHGAFSITESFGVQHMDALFLGVQQEEAASDVDLFGDAAIFWIKGIRNVVAFVSVFIVFMFLYLKTPITKFDAHLSN